MWSTGCDLVHCGFWIDYSKGTFQGPTITMPNQIGLIFGAFLALFISLAGGHLWGIICFATHQINATPKRQDDTHHQLQLTLRNAKSALNLVSNLVRIVYSREGTRIQSLIRLSPLITLAGLHTIAIFAASIFSSQAIARNDEVLTMDKSCGWKRDPAEFISLAFADNADVEATSSLLVMTRNDVRKSASYAQDCYRQRQGHSIGCDTYVRSIVPYHANLSVPCPFDDNICNGLGVAFDTGFIRSDLDLGINTHPDDSLAVRKVLTCAPLAGEKYADKNISIPEGHPSISHIPAGTTWTGWKFGRIAYAADFMKDYTFLVNDVFYKIGDSPYNLVSQSKPLNYSSVLIPNIEPIPELQSQVSDVIVVGLVNRMTYSTAVTDALYMAQNCTTNDPLSQAIGGCSATHIASFIGCKESYQICTKDQAQCSPLTGLHQIRAKSDKFANLSSEQKTVFKLLWEMMYSLQLNFQTFLTGPEYLVANEYRWSASAFLSNPVPENQWQIEVENWMNTTLAGMQRHTLSYARPPEFEFGSGVSNLKHILTPKTEVERSFCQKMKARSRAHRSFSIIRFVVIIAFGLAIIITDLSLSRVTAGIQLRTGKGLYKRLDWIETSAFQLQRMAAEGRGIGPWTGKQDDVPKLVEHGGLFSLTGESHKEAWSSNDGYKTILVQRMNEETEYGIERNELSDWKGRPNEREIKKPLQSL